MMRPFGYRKFVNIFDLIIGGRPLLVDLNQLLQ